MFGLHIETFFRAQFDTGLAVDTAEMVHGPDFFFKGYKDGIRRASSHANAAVNTCGQIDCDLAARACIGRAFKKRITACGWLFAECF